MTIQDLFIGTFPGCLCCCDKSRHENGDYKEIARISRFYQGNVSMAEAAVIAAYPEKNACITVDRHGKHQIAMEAERC